MRVAVVGPNTRGNGSTRVAVSWARMMTEAGHQVVFVASPPAQPADESPLPDAVRLVRATIPSGSRGWKRLRVLDATAAERLAELERESRFDVVTTHFQSQPIAVRKRLPHARMLCTWHSPFVDEDRLNAWKYGSARRRLSYPARRYLFARIERQALEAADHVHTLSGFTWGLLCRRYRSQTARLDWSAIRGSYDEERFVPASDRSALRARLELDPDVPMLLAIRRLVPRNAPERILAAAIYARSRGLPVQFVIGGTGELGPELERMIEQENLGKHVRLLGFVPENELSAYYQAADATLMPTRDLECFGLPVIESLACGTPCLATPVGAIPEILAPYPDLLSAGNTADSFCRLVVRFLRHEFPISRDELAVHARSIYSEAAIAPEVAVALERTANP